MSAAQLLCQLLQKPSVTPTDAGALAVIEEALAPLGFTLHRLRFGEAEGAPIDNLYARLGTEGPHFCFAGHTDVVPPGDSARWSSPPFAGAVQGDIIIGRGAVDMKGGIAAFIAALSGYLKETTQRRGSISLLITGDEEGVARFGTRAVLEWLAARGEKIDACLVGEPSGQQRVGDCLRVGRRGSLSAVLKVFGRQGHSAYPERADNPLPKLAALLQELGATPLDSGTADFGASIFVPTAIDTGNAAANVIPAEVCLRFNVRFNACHTRAGLIEKFTAAFHRHFGDRFAVEWAGDGEAFLIPDSGFRRLVIDAVSAIAGAPPECSTGGGTSDARFITRFAPVVELGLVGQTMHQIDERVTLADLDLLTRIYRRILDDFFAKPA